jgi:hypothetical protein
VAGVVLDVAGRFEDGIVGGMARRADGPHAAGNAGLLY